MNLFRINPFNKNIISTFSLVNIRFYGAKLHHAQTKKSVFSRMKVVPLGPTKPTIPNTEVEPPAFKIMTKHTGVQHGIAKKAARRVADKRGYKEPNKLVKRYIKLFVHDKHVRKLIDW